jgi:putative peptide zinc metalloprotease protein
MASNIARAAAHVRFSASTHPPAGLWEGLALRVSGSSSSQGVYHHLAVQLQQDAIFTTPGAALRAQLPSPVNREEFSARSGDVLRSAAENAPSLLLALKQRTDLAAYKPRARQGLVGERLREDGQRFTVLRSPDGNYLRLNVAESELWQAMDGTRSVTDLAILGLNRHKQLLPVADLVQSLRSQGFLDDRPTQLYQKLETRLSARTAKGWGQRLVQTLRSHRFAVSGIDPLIDALYRYGGWVFFTLPFLVLFALISSTGVAVFLLMVFSGEATFEVIDSQRVVPSLLALWAALLISFVCHELAHALATKHFGRRVDRAGVMLYYGMPAAFVDTSDIWAAGRRARIFVSLAGPMADLLLGALAALVALYFPATLLGSAAYKLAFACYIATLLNFNPLLELDGYFILVDWLRLPNLRRRALGFVRGPLWVKWRTKLPLTREERIFTLYGALTAFYTLLAIALTALFWQRQLLGVLSDLWQSGLVGQALAVLLVVAVVVPLCLGLLFAAWRLVEIAAAWLARQPFARTPAFVSAPLLTLTLLLALLPLRFGVSPELALIAPLLWTVALLAQLALRSDYRGAAIAPAMHSFLVVGLLEFVAVIGRWLNPDMALLWAIFELGSFLLLMFAGFITLLDVDLNQAPQRELALSAAMLVIAFAVGGGALHLIEINQPGVNFWVALLEAAPVYLSVLALALLIPQINSLRDSRLRYAWMLLALGITAQTVSYFVEVLPDWRTSALALSLSILAAGLWAITWCVHYVTLSHGLPRDLSWPLEPSLSEGERLQRAFQHSYAGCYRLLHTMYGSRRARALDDKMDILAATANWDLTLDRDRVRFSPALQELPLDMQGSRYAEVLDYTVTIIEELAGASFARHAIRAAYDALPWPEREAADRRCFPNTAWANELSRDFGDARSARLRLLRQVDIFTACDDTTLEQLAAVLRSVRTFSGQELLASGEEAHGLWIVETGEVDIWRGRTLVGEIHRGSYFGSANSLPIDEQRECSYRTTLESTLLFMPQADFVRLLDTPHTTVGEGSAMLATLRLLERVPLFADLPRQTLRDLARGASHCTVPAQTAIVQEGRASGKLYVIEQGRASVRTGATADEPERLIARLGPGEFFGELELLRGIPPMASVIADEKLSLVALEHSHIAALLMGSQATARSLEQIGSGRLIALRTP